MHSTHWISKGKLDGWICSALKLVTPMLFVAVERFSIGLRNPTAFLAGTLGIPADCYFAGVCCGCLFTLPIQLAVGFVLRERPVVALASVAAAVGVCTAFPYAAAACTALFLYLRRRRESSSWECGDPFRGGSATGHLAFFFSPPTLVHPCTTWNFFGWVAGHSVCV